MIDTVEAAVEKLNDVQHNGEEIWIVETPLYSGFDQTVLSEDFCYSAFDAIRIARSYELEEELQKWREEAEEILKHRLAIRVREGAGPENLRASLAVTFALFDRLVDGTAEGSELDHTSFLVLQQENERLKRRANNAQGHEGRSEEPVSEGLGAGAVLDAGTR